MSSFVELQERFAQVQSEAMGIPSSDFHGLQPSVLSPDSDGTLWSYFNAIPLDSKLYATTESEFFAAYSALIDSLVAGTSPLDSIKAAKKQLADWGTKPPAWQLGCAALASQLQMAPSRSFNFKNPSESNPGYWGLWGSSDPAPGPSAGFASGTVSANASFSNVLSFVTLPGDWYVSSAMSLAYRVKSGNPWNPKSPINWENTFGPEGTMPRFLASLIVVAGMNVQYQSTAAFSAADQSSIRDNASKGLWPYYPVANAATNVSFDSAGRASVSIQSKNPFVIAATVVSAGTFLGL